MDRQRAPGGAVVGTYLIVSGVFAFVWFMWGLNQRLHEPSGIMIMFGSLFVGLALVSALIRAAIPGGKVFGDTPVPAGADLARQLDNTGFAVLLSPEHCPQVRSSRSRRISHVATRSCRAG